MLTLSCGARPATCPIVCDSSPMLVLPNCCVFSSLSKTRFASSPSSFQPLMMDVEPFITVVTSDTPAFAALAARVTRSVASAVSTAAEMA